MPHGDNVRATLEREVLVHDPGDANYTVEVLNGYVEVGDYIAYPSRNGSSLEVRIAEVTAITKVKHPWYSELVPALTVRVIRRSEDAINARAGIPYVFTPYLTTIRELARVVRLGNG